MGLVLHKNVEIEVSRCDRALDRDHSKNAIGDDELLITRRLLPNDLAMYGRIIRRLACTWDGYFFDLALASWAAFMTSAGVACLLSMPWIACAMESRAARSNISRGTEFACSLHKA